MKTYTIQGKELVLDKIESISYIYGDASCKRFDITMVSGSPHIISVNTYDKKGISLEELAKTRDDLIRSMNNY